MDHGGEAPRPTTVGSTDLGMAGAVQGGEAHVSTGTFHGQLGAAAARRASFDELAGHVHAAAGHGEVPVAVFHLHHEPGPGVAYANIGASWQQPGPVDVVLVGPQLPDAVVPVHHNYGYSALQPRPGAGRGVGLVDLLPDGAGHGEVFISPLPDGVAAVFDNSGNLAQQTPATRRAEGIVGALPSLGAGYGGSRAVADDLGAAYSNLGIVVEYLRRLLPFAGIGACSVAVNGLAAAGPSSPAVAYHLFALLLGGLLLVILHVLRV